MATAQSHTAQRTYDTVEYWRDLARSERAFAAADRRNRFATVESIKIHEQNARDYDARADAIAAQRKGDAA